MSEVLVYDKVSKTWMTQAALDKLNAEREAQAKENK